ncbi:hypothetical protein [uncultured Winogradskyella sp.]|uniref:hypothetical protein n=1 Tax=uncultured Winogradskyella sp. TaxID=395353 RepID=UPI0026211B1D|nr:hypothetical protein [uncultured Winogradskyella sp.]
MKKLIFIAFALLLSLNLSAQRSRNTNQIPQTQSEPTEEQIAKHKRDMEERRDEYIQNFLSTLEADEFQKHIIKQNIISFFEAKTELYKVKYEHSMDRKNAVEKLEKTHFKDLEELISENDMTKLMEMIKGDFDEKEVIKKKKKKRKKKKQKKDK